MNPLRVYILEDELITQEVLKQTLESLNCVVCGVNTHAELALGEIKQLAPDLAFLDIKVDGDKTGLWLGKQLQIPIVYLTAFSDEKSVIAAASTDPIAYLPKPFKEKDLFIVLEMIKHKIKGKKELIVKERNLSVKIDFDRIVYAKKEDHYLILYTQNSKKVIRSTAQEFLDNATEDFIQVHRSYIVNKNFITGFSSKKILINTIEIPVSSSYADQVNDAII